ncbi:MAG: hypothetical protein IPI88_05880 [Chitinophagaceae bacterium]|nr:hypothetical protein [Chitinophagaceae bacterium]
MQYRLLLFFIITFFIWGCNDFGNNDKDISTKNLTGSWRLFDLENIAATNTQHAEKLLSEADNSEMVKQGLILSFFKDGSFTQVEGSGYYRTGKWKYSSKEKTINFTDSGTTTAIKVTGEIINKRLTISLESTLLQKNLKFARDAEPLKEFDEDPFYFKNNTWRIRPTQSETHDQLVKRLGNYFRHLLYILKSSKERKQDIVSFEFSQGLVRIYNGGIGIIPYGSVSKNWIDTFYDEANAREAYLAFQKYLVTNSYRGAAIGDWIQDDYNILLSIYGDTQKDKF